MGAIKASGLAPFLVLLSLIAVFPARADDAAIVINGDIISRDDYQYALSRYKETHIKDISEASDPEFQDKLKKDLINDIIDRQIYLQESKRRGVTARMFASEEEIEEIAGTGQVASEEEKAQRDRAERIVLSYKAREIIPSKTIAAIKEDLTFDDKGVQTSFLEKAEKMKVKYIKVDPYAMANSMTINDGDIKDYFRQHAADFSTPGYKEYSTLFFDPANMLDKTQITPQMTQDYYAAHKDDMRTEKLVKIRYVTFRIKDYTNGIYDTGVNPREYYEENVEKFGKPAEAHVRMLVVKKPADPEKIRSLAADLRSGTPFAELVKKYSDDQTSAENGGDIGYIESGSLKEPYNTIAFAMKSGDVSGIIETDKEFAVISVEDKKDERLMTYDEARDQIEESLLMDSARPLALNEAKRFKLMARKSSFDKAASKMNRPVYESDYFTAASSIPSIGGNPMFLEAAFSLASGEVSDEIFNDDSYIVLSVDGVTPQAQLDYPDVEEKIKAIIGDEEEDKLAYSAASSARDMIAKGTSLADVIRNTKAHVTITRMPATMESPSDTGSVESRSDGYFLTVLSSTIQPKVPSYEEVSTEAAAAYAFAKADALARDKAKAAFFSGAVTLEGTETPLFSRSDYLIGGEYMRQFIEQSFQLKTGQTGILKNSGKYYVTLPLDRGVGLSGDTSDNSILRSQVLREKRIEYANEWLKDQRRKAVIKVNI